MEPDVEDRLFDITGKTIAVTGGASVLCGALSEALAARGAKFVTGIVVPADGGFSAYSGV